MERKVSQKPSSHIFGKSLDSLWISVSTSFMFIGSLLLCPLHGLAAMSHWSSSKNTESISVSCAVSCWSYVSRQREESFRGELTLITFAFSPVLPNLSVSIQAIFHVHQHNNFRQGRSMCLLMFVSKRRYGRRWPIAFFNTWELVYVFPDLTHWVAAGAVHDHCSEVCRSGTVCVFVN